MSDRHMVAIALEIEGHPYNLLPKLKSAIAKVSKAQIQGDILVWDEQTYDFAVLVLSPSGFTEAEGLHE